VQHSFLQKLELLLLSGLQLREFLRVVVNGFKTDLRIGVHRFWPDFAIGPHPAIQAGAHAGLLGENGYAKTNASVRAGMFTSD
jgi:hypothetical protein